MENTIKETTRLLLQGTLTKHEADKILLDLHNVNGQFSLEIVKKAFNTFHYGSFPHNHPTWDEWAKENCH
jgi:hypothetical protein